LTGAENADDGVGVDADVVSGISGARSGQQEECRSTAEFLRTLHVMMKGGDRAAGLHTENVTGSPRDVHQAQLAARAT
jgi:hypothetical protein